MTKAFQSLIQTLNDLIPLLNSSIHPNLVKSGSKPQPVKIRHKFIIIAHIFLAFVSVADILFNPTSLRYNIDKILLCSLIIASVSISIKYGSHIFYYLYTIICLSSGPLLISREPEKTYTIFFEIHTIPIFTYLFTGSQKLFIFQSIAQTFYLNFLYKPYLQSAVTFTNPEEFTNTLISSTTFNIFVFAIVTLLHHPFMQPPPQSSPLSETINEEGKLQRKLLFGSLHELFNLIKKIKKNITLANKETSSNQGKDVLEAAQLDAEISLNLLDNIRDTGKVETENLEINPTSTKISDTLVQIWALCSKIIERKGLKGHMRIQRHLPRLMMVDGSRLKQIFVNIVENALNFSGKGEIEINVRLIKGKESVDDRCFEVSSYREEDGPVNVAGGRRKWEENNIVLSTKCDKIEENSNEESSYVGEGVLKTNIMVRDAEYKISQEEADMRARTQVGLFVAQQLCQKMKGEIRAVSRESIGSSFIFCIPVRCVQRDDELYALELITSYFRNNQSKALIVDSNGFSDTILRAFYRKLEIKEIEFANNGLEALQKYTQNTSSGSENCQHVITIDICLPVMNGMEAARRIRRYEKENRIKPCFLILMAVGPTELEVRECLDKNGEIQADAFLRRPFRFKDLKVLKSLIELQGS